MSRCHVCGSIETKEEYTNEIFQIDYKPVLVEHIPATVVFAVAKKPFVVRLQNVLAVWYKVKQNRYNPFQWRYLILYKNQNG